MTGINIDKLTFSAGPRPEGEELEISLPGVTLLVGPNHSGKSQTLEEIENWARDHNFPGPVLDEVDISYPDNLDTVLDVLEPLMPHEKHETDSANMIHLSYFQVDSSDSRTKQIDRDALDQAIEDRDESRIRDLVARPLTIRFRATTRFNLVEDQDCRANPDSPCNHLESLLFSDDSLARVRGLIDDTLDHHILLDPVTNPGRVRVRLADEPPPTDLNPRSQTAKTQDYLREQSHIAGMSDGVQALTGLICGVESLPHSIVLIDDPEAFLHPPLVRDLGEHLASIANRRDGSLVVATHSPAFVQGCIEAGVDVEIVRLTYNQTSGAATARSIEDERISNLMKDPLIRSTGTLEGLFHEGVVVCEGDTDRAFYDEINRRLRNEDGRGAPDTLFLNAHGKSELHRIVSALRDLGVPAAAVYDLDVLDASNQKWREIFDASSIPSDHRDSLLERIGRTETALEDIETGQNSPPAIDEGGIDLLSNDDRDTAQGLLDTLGQYGVFLVPGGEVETWLENLQVEGKSTAWLREMLTSIGRHPDEGAYVAPGQDDVWAFIDQIGDWIRDQTRDGMDSPDAD